MAIEKTLTTRLDLIGATWGDLRKLVVEADRVGVADTDQVHFEEADDSDPMCSAFHFVAIEVDEYL